MEGRLRASWRRSERYGVSPDEVSPVYTESVDTGSLLYDCAFEVLTGLQSTIANEPVGLMVADANGLVLARLCNDPSILRSLDRVHLAPGFSYAERNAGTNGLGLSLADRVPTLVRAGEHYCTELRRYTCAAVPVVDPVGGDLAGSINLTTWSESSSELLLALAQAAAGATSAMMLVRATGRMVRPAPRGEVFSVTGGASEGAPCTSAGWRTAHADALGALAAGRVTAVVGEPGVGKATLAAQARRSLAPRSRILHARAPEAGDVPAWLELWTPELRKPDTFIIVSGLHTLPAWAAGELARLFAEAPAPVPFVFTTPDFTSLPDELALLVDALVEVPPLRTRPDDVLPLARHVARSARRREVTFTPRAAAALTAYHWPGNAAQLREIVRDAVMRATVVDLQHLGPEILDRGSRPLTRLEKLERDEIVRCLVEPNQTMTHAAEELGIGRATLYRKIAHYKIALP
ncbi:helix-turn-helix domain-containing protein [Cryptosporangium phraense]|uniref:Fis family transcriptional regulator n=1 Tax=Cryptosporangium phraense TaxID=2593070 RepID=A0A545B0E6_9ACTN|nr:helix-turn-helix domain-containing protein [Cryptosporangium phraense]TQS47052.1 Fis family transcriptional regulator [Cryptosporangium phraense]